MRRKKVEDIGDIKEIIAEMMTETSEKLAEALASLVAMGWTEEEARKIVDDMLRDLPTKGSA